MSVTPLFSVEHCNVCQFRERVLFLRIYAASELDRRYQVLSLLRVVWCPRNHGSIFCFAPPRHSFAGQWLTEPALSPASRSTCIRVERSWQYSVVCVRRDVGRAKTQFIIRSCSYFGKPTIGPIVWTCFLHVDAGTDNVLGVRSQNAFG